VNLGSVSDDENGEDSDEKDTFLRGELIQSKSSIKLSVLPPQFLAGFPTTTEESF
jgi:hypothetical protein